MPINPYDQQMQTMAAQGIPVQTAAPAVNPATQLPQQAPLAGRQAVANVMLRNNEDRMRGGLPANFDMGAFRQQQLDWRGSKPSLQEGYAALSPAEQAGQVRSWLAARPQRPGLGNPNQQPRFNAPERVRPGPAI